MGIRGIHEADSHDKARSLVETFVISDRMAEQLSDVVFPNLQFFVATHSPLVASGAGDDAITYLFNYCDGKSSVEKTANVAAMDVDRVLQSKAFGLVSPFSPQTQRKLDRFDSLRKNKQRSKPEENELKSLYDFIDEAKPIGGPAEPGSLKDKIDSFLRSKLHDPNPANALPADPQAESESVAFEPVGGKNGKGTQAG